MVNNNKTSNSTNNNKKAKKKDREDIRESISKLDTIIQTQSSNKVAATAAMWVKNRLVRELDAIKAKAYNTETTECRN